MRTGLYTSPHLARANERIRMDGVEIADDDFARLYFRVHDAAQQLLVDGRLAQLPSYFEILTAQAFCYFAECEARGCGAGSGHGWAAGRDQCRGSAAFSDYRHLARPHGMAGLDDLRNHTGEGRDSAQGGTMITLPQHPEANQVLGEVATELGVRGVSAAGYVAGRGNAWAPTQLQALGRGD